MVSSCITYDINCFAKVYFRLCSICVLLLVLLNVCLFQERDIKFFTETEENSAMMAPRAGVPYFLWYYRFRNSDDMISRSLFHVSYFTSWRLPCITIFCTLHLVGFAPGRYWIHIWPSFKLIMDSLIHHFYFAYFCLNLNTGFFFAQNYHMRILWNRNDHVFI
jgi:hypothetical protein